METLEELKKKQIQILSKITKLEESRKKELLPIYRKKYIGKCFKYRNGYGADELNWWLLYSRITDVKDINFYNGEQPIFESLQFEVTSRGIVEVKLQESQWLGESPWIEIEYEEYLVASRNLLVQVRELFSL